MLSAFAESKQHIPSFTPTGYSPPLPVITEHRSEEKIEVPIIGHVIGLVSPEKLHRKCGISCNSNI